MLINKLKPLPFVNNFCDDLNEALTELKPHLGLSRSQIIWLAFCMTAIMVTNTVCWAKFQRICFGQYSHKAISWMFKNSKIPWDVILQMSVKIVLRRYNISEGVLLVDESKKERSKITKVIANVFKMKETKHGGYINGQNLVFLVLATDKITIPVGFSYFVPDPKLSAWNKEDRKLKEKGVPKSKRPPKPERDPNYPKIPQIALNLLKQFSINHSEIKIRTVLADALYGTTEFLDGASHTFGCNVQTISQVKPNQKILFKGKKIRIDDYFSKHPGVKQKIKIRGGKEVTAIVGSARMHLCAHNKKRFIIAIKYECEEEYRYLVASHLSWRTLDIVVAYTLRWLIEVFFEDWKANEGWNNLTKQPGEDGSSRSLILSLLVDHCLFYHPDQLACIENNLPAWTVGSLINKIKFECLLGFIQDIVENENPVQKLNNLTELIKEHSIKLLPSSKHMVNMDFSNFKPAESLKYKTA